jgi:hypothetical protein
MDDWAGGRRRGVFTLFSFVASVRKPAATIFAPKAYAELWRRSATLVEWYVGRGGRAFGPMTFATLADAARCGELRREDYVWQTGAETWEPATCVAALWDPPPLPSATDTSAFIRKKRRRWLRIVVLGLAVSGALVATGVAGIDVSELMLGTKQGRIDADHARPIKRDCALNEYLQGKCR